MDDRRRRGVALAVLGTLALLAVVVWVPYLVRTREVLLATPGPEPLDTPTLIALPAGGQTCVDSVTLDPELAAVRTRVVAPRGSHGGPVDVRVYDAANRLVGRGSFPAGFAVPALLGTSVRQSLSHSTVGTVCLVNHGPALTMQGTD